MAIRQRKMRFEVMEELAISEESAMSEEKIALEEGAVSEETITQEEPVIPEPNEFGRFVDGVFRDWIEVSAYKGTWDGIDENLFYDSRYTHLKEEMEVEEEEENPDEQENLVSNEDEIDSDEA